MKWTPLTQHMHDRLPREWVYEHSFRAAIMQEFPGTKIRTLGQAMRHLRERGLMERRFVVESVFTEIRLKPKVKHG